MASRTDIRYVQLPLEPGIVAPLGLSPGPVSEGGAGVEQIRAALRRYGTALDLSRSRLARVFDRAEWNLMADVMNGCLDIYDYAETSLSVGTMIMANVQDGHALNGVGYKWFGEEEGVADARVEALIRKVVKLSPIEADAVAVAIRSFWSDPSIDATTEEWWLPKPFIGWFL